MLDTRLERNRRRTWVKVEQPRLMRNGISDRSRCWKLSDTFSRRDQCFLARWPGEVEKAVWEAAGEVDSKARVWIEELVPELLFLDSDISS